MENENEMAYAETLALNAACNAICIAKYLPDGALMPDAVQPMFGRVAQAAAILAKMETMPTGTNEFWECGMHVDWETACRRLAVLVASGSSVVYETVTAAVRA